MKVSSCAVLTIGLIITAGSPLRAQCRPTSTYEQRPYLLFVMAMLLETTPLHGRTVTRTI